MYHVMPTHWTVSHITCRSRCHVASAPCHRLHRRLPSVLLSLGPPFVPPGRMPLTVAGPSRCRGARGHSRRAHRASRTTGTSSGRSRSTASPRRAPSARASCSPCHWNGVGQQEIEKETSKWRSLNSQHLGSPPPPTHTLSRRQGKAGSSIQVARTVCPRQARYTWGSSGEGLEGGGGTHVIL